MNSRCLLPVSGVGYFFVKAAVVVLVEAVTISNHVMFVKHVGLLLCRCSYNNIHLCPTRKYIILAFHLWYSDKHSDKKVRATAVCESLFLQAEPGD